jgi:phage replication-related protein YjqB (UPF0714/DUF867 family)
MKAVEVIKDPRITFRDLLGLDGVQEHSVLRGQVGFMAYHGGSLEQMTDVIAAEAATMADASYYGVIQPPGSRIHISSTKVDPEHSERLREFLDHVDVVITVHGFGRKGFFTSLLLGGRNRTLAEHVGGHLRSHLPAYEIVTDLNRIPGELSGQHLRNPVNLPRGGGVQVELPPRVRGSSPMWWDWEHGLTPHTRAVIDGLADAARLWTHSPDDTHSK